METQGTRSFLEGPEKLTVPSHGAGSDLQTECTCISLFGVPQKTCRPPQEINERGGGVSFLSSLSGTVIKQLTSADPRSPGFCLGHRERPAFIPFQRNNPDPAKR